MSLYCNTQWANLKEKKRKAPKGGYQQLDLLIQNPSMLTDLLSRLDSKNVIFDTHTLVCPNVTIVNNSVYIDQLSNGLDYLTLQVIGNAPTNSKFIYECLPVQLFIYWDGKKYRGIAPLAGNNINTNGGHLFGINTPHTKQFDDEYCQQYFGKNYDECKDDIKINFPMCLQAFENKIDVY